MKWHGCSWPGAMICLGATHPSGPMVLALVQMISALRQGISPPGPGYAWRAGMFPDSLVFWPIVCVEGLPLSEASA